MANQRLTKTFIDRIALPPKKANGTANQVLYWDTALPRFGVRVGSGGTKTFIVEKRINGRTKRMTVGRYGELTVEQAREQAVLLLAEVAKGKDPIAERKAKVAHAVTLAEAYQAYLTSRKDLKPGTIKNYTKCVDGCFNDWKPKRLVDISKDMVEKRHREIGKRAPARANNAMRVLRAIFNHAMHAYEDADGNPFITINPVDRLSKNREWYPNKRRKTLLKSHQLKPWFEATEQLNNTTSRDYFQFLLLTGLRKMEGASLRWTDVDMIDKTFTIADTKNREPHTLPLTDYLFAMFERRQAESDSPWVFPSKRSEGHMTEPSMAIKKVIKISGVSFTLHDLRRTFTTIAESLDISAYAVKRLINHRMENDVTAGYIIADVNRLRDPMQRITTFIMGTIKSEQ